MRIQLILVGAALVGCGSTDTASSSSPPGGGTVVAAPDIPAVDVGTKLATVGESVVGSKDFEAAASRHVPEGGGALTAEDKKTILDELIADEALWQEAVRQGFYKNRKVQKMMVNLLLRDQVYDKVRASDFTPEEMSAYFEANREDFVVPEKVQVKRIFLTTGEKRSEEEAMTLAADLRAQLVADPDRFRDLATEHSDGPFARRGGDMGYLSHEGKPGLDPVMVERAFELNVNQISQPFKSAEGINIITVVAKRERVERTFDQMKGSVLRKLKNERYSELETAFVKEVLERYPVEVDTAAVNNLDLSDVQPVSPDLEAAASGPGGD